MGFPSATLYLYLMCFITFLFVLKRKGTRKPRPNLPPSPPKLPIIGNIHQLGTLPHRSFRDLSLKYGPLLWLQLGQLPVLLVSSAHLARELLKNQDVVFANRFQSIAVRTLLYGCKDVAFANYGESWKKKKKLCVVELLSLKRVRSFQFIRDEGVAEMVNKIRRACLSDNNCSVNMSELISATANNIICRCIIGQKFETEESSRFGDLARKVVVQLGDISLGDVVPSLGWVDYVTGKMKELKENFTALDSFFDEVIAEHKKMKKDDGDKKDFVDILLQLQESDQLDFDIDQDNLKAILTVRLYSIDEFT